MTWHNIHSNVWEFRSKACILLFINNIKRKNRVSTRELLMRITCWLQRYRSIAALPNVSLEQTRAQRIKNGSTEYVSFSRKKWRISIHENFRVLYRCAACTRFTWRWQVSAVATAFHSALCQWSLLSHWTREIIYKSRFSQIISRTFITWNVNVLQKMNELKEFIRIYFANAKS